MATSASTGSVLGRIWQHLSRRRRWQLPGVVLPFLGMIVTPERVFQYRAVARLAAILGITTSGQLVLPLTLPLTLINIVGFGILFVLVVG